MGYDVKLVDPQGLPYCLDTPHFEGGQGPVGGQDKTKLYVTYNYSFFFREALHKDGLRVLDGMLGEDAEYILRNARDRLGGWDDPLTSYWEATASNAARALNVLLEWSTSFPEGVFHVI